MFTLRQTKMESQKAAGYLGFHVRLKEGSGVDGDLIIIYPKSYSIYLRWTIGFWDLGVRALIICMEFPKGPCSCMVCT